MNINRNSQGKAKKGSALALVLVMVAAVSIILTSLLGYVTSQIKYSDDRVERERAFQIAEAGVYYYKWYLAHELSGQTAQQIEDFWGAGGGPIGTSYEAEFSDPEGSAIGKYNLEIEIPTAGSTIVMVTSTGWTYKKPTVKRVVQVRLRRPSWSEYMFLSDKFLNFGNQAIVYGRVHSNGGIRFDGKAYDVVSSKQPHFDDTTYGGNREEFGVHTTINPADDKWTSGETPTSRPEIFVQGREFPVPEIVFNGVSADLSNMKAKAQNEIGKYFNDDGDGRMIVLKTNDTYDVCTVMTANANTHAITRYFKNSGPGWCSSCSGDCATNYPIIDNGVIFVEDNIWLDGSIDGKRLSVVAADLSGGAEDADIYIGVNGNDLTYATHDCYNMLGLVAQHDVRILPSCPQDFIVDAALLAKSGRVGINDVGSFPANSILRINGAIASYLQTYFINGNNGFGSREYNFNNNLLYCPPPYFPTGTEYSIDQWDEL